MSSGTFSLVPGPPSVAIDAASFAGTQIAGLLPPGFTSISLLCLDVAARVKEAPVPIVQAAYARAARDLCKRSMWLKRNITNQVLTINQPAYNFGSDPNLEVIGIEAGQIQQQNLTWINLRPGDPDNFDPNMKTDLPTYYSYVPEGSVLFYPTPNAAYLSAMELTVQTSLNATAIPNDLVSKFNIYIEEGAMWHLYMMDKEEWANMPLAMEAKQNFFEGVGMARSWKDKANQQGSVRATPRPFIAR
jgi:hypothetical protein